MSQTKAFCVQEGKKNTKLWLFKHIATTAVILIPSATLRKTGFNEYFLKIMCHNIEGVKVMILTSSTETGNTTRLREGKEGRGGNGEGNGERDK